MSLRNQIVILEDDHRRRVEMFRCLDLNFAHVPVHFFRTASELEKWLTSNWDFISLASLDHDLEDLVLSDGHKIPAGTGRDAADALIRLGGTRDRFPILIHSTNVPASHGMLEALRDAKWTAERIAPYSDRDWIEQDWLPTLNRMINKQPISHS